MSNGFDVSPQAQLHQFRNRLLDEFYDKFDHTEDGEIANEEAAKVYHDVAYEGSFSNRMRLFYDSTSSITFPAEYVESCWFQCLICGFTLPAIRKTR